jgi:hypothetical protein
VPQQLLLGMLQYIAAAAATGGYTPQQLCCALTAVGQLGVAAAGTVDQKAVYSILGQLADHHLASLPTGHLVNMLTALGPQGLAVPPDHAFMVAVQRDLQPRLTGLEPVDFSGLAQALAAFGAQLDKDVLDGYWSVLQPRLTELTVVDQVHLLQGLGALPCKPRPTVLGQLLATAQAGLTKYDRGQLLTVLQALSQLQLSAEDTQVRERVGEKGGGQQDKTGCCRVHGKELRGGGSSTKGASPPPSHVQPALLHVCWLRMQWSDVEH